MALLLLLVGLGPAGGLAPTAPALSTRSGLTTVDVSPRGAVSFHEAATAATTTTSTTTTASLDLTEGMPQAGKMETTTSTTTTLKITTTTTTTTLPHAEAHGVEETMLVNVTRPTIAAIAANPSAAKKVFEEALASVISNDPANVNITNMISKNDMIDVLKLARAEAAEAKAQSLEEQLRTARAGLADTELQPWDFAVQYEIKLDRNRETTETEILKKLEEFDKEEEEHFKGEVQKGFADRGIEVEKPTGLVIRKTKAEDSAAYDASKIYSEGPTPRELDDEKKKKCKDEEGWLSWLWRNFWHMFEGGGEPYCP